MLARSLYRPLSRSVALSPYSLTSLSRSPLALAPLRTVTTKAKDFKEKKGEKFKSKAEKKDDKVDKKHEKAEKKEDKVDKKHEKAEKDGKVEKKEDKVEKKEDKEEKKETKTDSAKVEKKAEKESTKEKDTKVEKKEEEKKEEKKMEKKEEEEKEPKIVVKVKEETVVVEEGKTPVHESVTSKATLKIDKDGNPKLKLKEKVEVDGEVVEKQKVTIKGQDNDNNEPNNDKKDKKDKKKKDKKKKKNADKDKKEKKEPANAQPILTMPLDDFYIVDSSIAIPVLNVISPPPSTPENKDNSAATLIANPPEFVEWVNKLKETGGKLHVLPNTRARLIVDGELPLPLVELKKVPAPEKERVIAMLDRTLAHLKGSRAKVDTSAAELLTAGWSMTHVNMKGKDKEKAPVFLTGNLKLWKYVLIQGKEKLTNILRKHKLEPLIAVRTIGQKSTWMEFNHK